MPFLHILKSACPIPVICQLSDIQEIYSILIMATNSQRKCKKGGGSRKRGCSWGVTKKGWTP